MKTCTKCQRELPTSEFYKSKLGAGGLKSNCKSCNIAAVLAWRQREGNQDKHRENTSRYYHRRGWSALIRQKYGLSEAQYAQLYDSQDGRCAICREPESQMIDGRVKRIAVDHEGSGADLKVRGLLCAGCNTGLGAFGHDLGRMERAALYLERFAEQPETSTGTDADA